MHNEATNVLELVVLLFLKNTSSLPSMSFTKTIHYQQLDNQNLPKIIGLNPFGVPAEAIIILLHHHNIHLFAAN
jgi:hypothetical protein